MRRLGPLFLRGECLEGLPPMASGVPSGRRAWCYLEPSRAGRWKRGRNRGLRPAVDAGFAWSFGALLAPVVASGQPPRPRQSGAPYGECETLLVRAGATAAAALTNQDPGARRAGVGRSSRL